jgi:hypothetical protein
MEQILQDIEEWREIRVSPLYSVSSYGRVRFNGHLRHVSDVRGHVYDIYNKPRILKVWQGDDKHYPTVAIYTDHKRYRFAIHQLVAEHFLGPCPEGQEVRHRDGNKLDSRVSNLEYGTRLQNIHDKERHGTMLRGEAAPWSKLSESQVLEIRSRVRNGEVQRRLAEEFGVGYMSISRIVNGTRWKHI